MKQITRTFFTGLAVIFPAAVTIYLLIWVAILIERALDSVLRFVLPQAVYVPGLGVAVGVALIFLVGLVMRTSWVARSGLEWTERLMYRLPLVKSVYGMLRDFSNFMTRPHKQGMQQVALVRIGDMRLMGFVTRKDFTGLPPELAEPDGTVAVYLPMSYQIGGYTVMVPRASVQLLDMSLEEATRFILTAGLSLSTPAKTSVTPGP